MDPKPEETFKDFKHPDDASFDKLVAAIDRAYHRPFRMAMRSFLHGMMTALGATVGAGLVFLILFTILRTVDFGPYAEKFQNLIIPESIRKQLDPEAFASPSNQQNQALQQAIDTYLKRQDSTQQQQ
ncbi:hypothetical protein BH11PAT4_BH11PAT4_6920 [soil metagenome]